MDRMTIEFQPTKRDRAIRPVCGALAALATVITLGLFVVGPVMLTAPGAATTYATAGTSTPTEVAIVPGSIDVVATRVPLARVEGRHVVLVVHRTR